MKNAPFTAETLITIIGVFIIFAITLSGKFDLAWVLIILGGICLLYGLIGVFKKLSQQTSEERKKSPLNKSLLQIILGGFILMLGLVELLDMQLSQNFWNGILLIICAIAILWFFFNSKNLFKK